MNREFKQTEEWALYRLATRRLFRPQTGALRHEVTVFYSVCRLIAYMQSLHVNVVVDTDVWVAGVRGSGHANGVLRLCLEGRFIPLMGAALLAEYEDLLGRESLWRKARLTADEREALFDIFLSVCQWTRIYFAWRPNFADEADNHLMELAVAGRADYIVTRNVRDLRAGELRFPHISVVTPTQLLKERA